ncbi:Aromatic amino acid aminotransferase [Paramyrothecium foliicola]|nr:Aromatic amino acid aminotransferase [Paramyrothecium foliicola]
MSRLHDAVAAAALPARHEKEQRPSAIDKIMARRAQAGKLVAGTAAASDSDMFKEPAARHLKKPGLISLGGGLPSSQVFPFSELSMTVPVVPRFSEDETLQSAQTVSIGKYDVRDRGGVYDLSIGLNYGQSNGSAQMTRFITEHTEIVFQPPYADWQCCQTIGSTGALEQAVRMLCDKGRNDSVLTEEFSFSTALETIAPLDIKVFGSPIDAQGLLPDAMDELLSGWDESARGARKPHVLYTIPCGHNPTGATQGRERRQAIYQVAQKHDLYIIEDDPYYYLQMQPYTGANQPDAPAPDTVEHFVSSLLPSLLSLDVDGRVMRMDSFSKILVPGSRLGWITASAQMVERYQRHAEMASQGPSGFSQLLLYKLLDETWGHEGFLRWLMHMRLEYTKKRDSLLAACEEHLPRDIVNWNPPAAGMFLWFQINCDEHPHAATRSVKEIEEEIFNSCINNGVLVARGSWFQTEKDKALPGLFFRATFAAASAEGMSEAIRRFGQAVKSSFDRALLRLGFPESHHDTLARRQHDISLEGGVTTVDVVHIALYAVESLEQTAENVAHLGKGELLTYADARSGIEGDIVEGLGVPVRPALGAEDFRIWEGLGHGGVQVGTALHDEGGVADRSVLEDGKGLRTVLAAASGQRGILQGEANVEGDDRVESQDLVQEGLEVGHVLDVFVGWGAVEADRVQDFLAQLSDRLGVAAQLVYGPRKGGCSGITAGEQDGNQLVTEDLGVSGEAGELVKERVSLIGLGLVGKLFRGEEKSALDVLVNELIDGLEAGPEALLGHETAELGGSHNDVLHALNFVEGFGELLPGVATEEKFTVSEGGLATV